MLARRIWIGMLVVFAVCMPRIAHAQAPWVVTVVATLDPLPIGMCGAVRVTLADATGNTRPRNAAGFLMSIADFDMSVTARDPRAVVGQQIDASHFSVCACQAGIAGTEATITATYPAERLATNARARGVAFQTTATVKLAAAKGAIEPRGCEAVAPATIATAGTLSTSLPPSQSGRPVTSESTPPRLPSGGGATTEAPLTVAPAGAPAPRAPAAGAAPTDVAVTGIPLIARVTWSAAPGATRYAVWRKDDQRLSVQKSSATLSATEFVDTLPDPRPTYRYTVVAHYADGTSGEAPAVQWISPPMINPSGFTMTQTGQTSTHAVVTFAWNAVPGAVRYRLDGPGIPNTGHHVKDTTAFFPTIPRGAGSWKVSTLYVGNFADYATATMISKVIRILPKHSQPWLTKNNGPGSQDNVQMPREGKHHCTSGFGPCWYEDVLPNQLQHPYDANYAKWLGNVLLFSTEPRGLQIWLDSDIKLWTDSSGHALEEAVYGNAGDLGVGRRSFCAQRTRTTQLPGVYTVCYASAHGIAPGQPGFNDPQVITRPGRASDSTLLLTMVITKEPTGSVFMVFSPAKKFTLSPTVTLDTEGAKYVPHACLSCHGGTYNNVTHKVDGASFLPIDPDLQLFKSAAEKSKQQFAIRRINEIIAKSGSSPAVVAYINGLYGNAVNIPHQHAKTDYVPSGWQSQSGLYKQIVRPYCAMCHLAAPSDLSFASWSNFQSNAGRIKAAVCGAHTMPHAEIQYKEFWLKDTGALYLPGLLASSLGFPSC